MANLLARMCRVACVETTQDAHLWRFADEPKFDIVHLTMIVYRVGLLTTDNKRLYCFKKASVQEITAHIFVLPEACKAAHLMEP